jgi:DNA repair exonuclease SbcCD ATPase subunit
MPKSGARPPELVSTAEAVEAEVRRLEELSHQACNTKLNSEKNIARAARELQQTLEQRERLAETLRTLGQVLERMQARQQAALEPLSARANEIQERMGRLTEHMQRFGAVGTQAGEVARALQTLPDTRPSEPGALKSAASTLMEVDERFVALVAEAKDLAQSAQAEDFPEVAREADALKQKLHAMRAHLAELVRAHSVGNG